EGEPGGAGGGADAPGETPPQLRGAERVGAAVEIETAAVAARLAHGDANGLAPAGVDGGRLRARRRARNKGFDALEPAASRRQRYPLADVPPFRKAEAQPRKLGPDPPPRRGSARLQPPRH